MSRLLFFLLLVANLAFGAHLWLGAQPAGHDFSRRERNRDEVKIVAVIPPLVAALKAEAEAIYTWNARDFLRLSPAIASRVKSPDLPSVS